METAIWEIEVRDKNGKLLTKRRKRSKSYLRQYLGLLKGLYTLRYGLTGFDENSTVIDEDGVSRTYPKEGATVQYASLPLNAPSGVSTYGLCVGTSDAVNTKDTYCLGAKILNGTASGQLVYGAHTVEAIYNPPATNDWLFRIIRTFTNNSPASITVREIGITISAMATGSVQRFFVIARDVISSTLVPIGATLTVRYIPKITVA